MEQDKLKVGDSIFLLTPIDACPIASTSIITNIISEASDSFTDGYWVNYINEDRDFCGEKEGGFRFLATKEGNSAKYGYFEGMHFLILEREEEKEEKIQPSEELKKTKLYDFLNK